MNTTFIWRSLRAAADDADRRLTGCQVAAMASGFRGAYGTEQEQEAWR